MSHRYHPDSAINDNPASILFDNCSDCEGKAGRFGVELDNDRWSALWRRMLVAETSRYKEIFTSDSDKAGITSANEQKLARQMYYLYLMLERFEMHDIIRQLGRG